MFYHHVKAVIVCSTPADNFYILKVPLYNRFEMPRQGLTGPVDCYQAAAKNGYSEA